MSKQFSTEHIDKAIEKLNEEPKQSIADDLKAYFTQMLKNADFVQVVRCKDCKHYFIGNCMNTDVPIYADNGAEFMPDSDFYCSYAERKEAK